MAERVQASTRTAWPVTALAIAVLLLVGWRVLRPDAAPVRQAERSLSSHADPRLTDQLARAAIRARPLDGRGYRLLAQSALVASDLQRAAALYALAGTRGPRDLQTQGWLVNHALTAGDYRMALSRLDQMLRIQPELSPQLFPVLTSLAGQATAQPVLAQLLGRRPPWRLGFLLALFDHGGDSAGLFPLVQRLQSAPGALSDRELSGWLDRLIKDRQWGPAYLAWVDSLPPARRQHIGNIYNGSFEDEPSLLGFDWRFERIVGARISRDQATGAVGARALRIAFEDRRVPFQHVRQLMALGPGDYDFSGRSRLEQLRTDRGLVWTLTCAEDSRVIAETAPLTGQHGWLQFHNTVTVPAQGCGGQWLTLRLPARIPAEQRIGGVAWFDDLQMRRLASR